MRRPSGITALLAVLALVLAIDIGLMLTFSSPEVITVTTEPAVTAPRRSPRGSVAAANTSTSTGTTGAQSGSGAGDAGDDTASDCPASQPDPTWVCQSGTWQPPGSGMGSVARAGGCAMVQPAPTFVCRDGVWTVPAGETSAAVASTAAASPASGRAAGPAAECPTPSPAAGWLCRDGIWQPELPNAPLSPSASSSFLPSGLELLPLTSTPSTSSSSTPADGGVQSSPRAADAGVQTERGDGTTAPDPAGPQAANSAAASPSAGN